MLIGDRIVAGFAGNRSAFPGACSGIIICCMAHQAGAGFSLIGPHFIKFHIAHRMTMSASRKGIAKRRMAHETIHFFLRGRWRKDLWFSSSQKVSGSCKQQCHSKGDQDTFRIFHRCSPPIDQPLTGIGVRLKTEQSMHDSFITPSRLRKTCQQGSLGRANAGQFFF